MTTAIENAELRGRITELLQRIKSRVEKTQTLTHLYRHDYMAIRSMLALDDQDGSIARQLLTVEFNKINTLNTMMAEMLEWKRLHEQCLMLIEYINKRLRVAHTICAYVKSDVIDMLLLPLSLLVNRAINQVAAIVGV